MINDRIEHSVRAMLFQYCSSLEFGWSSACSGSDSPAWVWQALTDYFGDKLGHGSFSAPHIVSAELASNKRNWIKRVHAPLQLFDDIFKLSGRQDATNHMTGKVEFPDPNRRNRSWFIGFSCKTLSGLNTVRRAEGLAITNDDCTTGLTFRGVLLILQDWQPKAFVLENVARLLSSGELKVCLAELQKQGYVMCWRKMDAKRFGLPQTRIRVYIWGWRQRDFAASHMSTDGLNKFCDRFTTQLEEGHALMDIDDFILPDSDWALLSHRASALSRSDNSSSSSFKRQKLTGGLQSVPVQPKWVSKHDEWHPTRVGQTHWSPSLASISQTVDY